MKGISAVVATYRRRDELGRLFDSIISNGLEQIEVIVVDQNQDGLLDELIAEYSSRLDIVHVKMEEPNQSKARNLGASKARYPIVCFPDDDCWFEPDSLQKVQRYFDNEPATDLLVINWKQNPMVHNESFRVTNQKLFSFRAVGYVTYVLFFNQGVFRKLGGFMETIGIGKYIGGGEDSELTFRAASRGMNIYYDADIPVNHKYIPITTRDLDTIRARQRAIGLMYTRYNVPNHIVLRGLVAPLVKMAFCFNREKAKQHYQMFLGRKEGLVYGWKTPDEQAKQPASKEVKNYLVYTTVTTWDEPPRARHQVTNELKADGVVYFVERNRVGRPRVELRKAENNVVVITPYFPVVYKVRYRTAGLNEIYHNWLLKKIKDLEVEFDMVISFDYTAPAINRYFDNVVFYCADDNVGFGNFNPSFINKYHTRTERMVAEKAKVCIVTSDYMGGKIGNYNRNTHVIPLGAPVIEYEKLNLPVKGKDLPTLAIVGYLDYNLDMELLYKLLDKFPTIFIGPVSEANKQKLARFKNAQFVGPKTGKDLYDCLSQADVCIAPYDVSKLNKGATPNKLWLYLALGKPAVVTNMPNINSWHFDDGVVYKCDNDQFIDCCIRAYHEDTPELAKKRVEVARSNSWKNRVQQIREIFNSSKPSVTELVNLEQKIA